MAKEYKEHHNNGPTPEEAALTRDLERRGVELSTTKRFSYKDRSGDIKYIKPDICIPRLKLAIEVDGDQHTITAQRQRDRKRDATIRSYGWEVDRIPNHIINNPTKRDSYAESIANEYRNAPPEQKEEDNTTPPENPRQQTPRCIDCGKEKKRLGGGRCVACNKKNQAIKNSPKINKTSKNILPTPIDGPHISWSPGLVTYSQEELLRLRDWYVKKGIEEQNPHKYEFFIKCADSINYEIKTGKLWQTTTYTPDEQKIRDILIKNGFWWIRKYTVKIPGDPIIRSVSFYLPRQDLFIEVHNKEYVDTDHYRKKIRSYNNNNILHINIFPPDVKNFEKILKNTIRTKEPYAPQNNRCYDCDAPIDISQTYCRKCQLTKRTPKAILKIFGARR